MLSIISETALHNIKCSCWEKTALISVVGPWQWGSNSGNPGLSCHHGGRPPLSGPVSNENCVLYLWQDILLNGRLCNDLCHHKPCHFQHLRQKRMSATHGFVFLCKRTNCFHSGGRLHKGYCEGWDGICERVCHRARGRKPTAGQLRLWVQARKRMFFLQMNNDDWDKVMLWHFVKIFEFISSSFISGLKSIAAFKHCCLHLFTEDILTYVATQTIYVLFGTFSALLSCLE